MPKDSFFNTENSKSLGILNLLNKELETNDYIEIPKHVKISKDPKWWIFTVLSFAGIFLGISKIGRAHVCTPVTSLSRMPSSA